MNARRTGATLWSRPRCRMLALGGGALGQTPPQAAAPLKIGIIGAGHIGGTLAALWVRRDTRSTDLLAPSG